LTLISTRKELKEVLLVVQEGGVETPADTFWKDLLGLVKE